MLKVSIITTVDHNVGDDFVREGIKYLLSQKLKGKEISFQHIHKHSPITTRYGFEWFRDLRFSRRVDGLLPIFLTQDRIMEADLVVQSGAPVYWCHSSQGHCCNNEWYEPLVRRRLRRKKNKKFISLAGGTCQAYFSKGDDFCPACLNYIEEFYKACQVTTVRDALSENVLAHKGLSAPVIPCSSIFAADYLGIKKSGQEYVVVNYMTGGAHFSFGQKIEVEKWESEFSKFYFELKKHERVIFSCHDQKEVQSALRIDPNAEIFFKEHDYQAYMHFYSKAKYGIVNRVHAGFLMASLDKPCFVVGNDSRARMVSHIGLENMFVNDVDCKLLLEKADFLSKGADNFSRRFGEIKSKAFADYMEALNGIEI